MSDTPDPHPAAGDEGAGRGKDADASATPPYQPIPCAQHERLEFAALTRQWLEVEVGGATQRLLPLDVYTRDGAEWLQARTVAGELVTLRLDRLRF